MRMCFNDVENAGAAVDFHTRNLFIVR